MKLPALLLTFTLLGLGGENPAELPRDLEIELARSALPDHLRADATVYVYHPGVGYRVAVEGTNGFHALVGRDDPAIRWASWTFTDYPDDILIPVAFDEAGVPAQLRVYLLLGEWRATGVRPEEAQRRLREMFQTGEIGAPDRSGVGYMLSPLLRAYQGDTDQVGGTVTLPHYMFYAPGVSNEDIGAGGSLRHPLMRPGKADPHGMIVVVAGAEERAAYTEEFAEMLADLCSLRENWCIPSR